MPRKSKSSRRAENRKIKNAHPLEYQGIQFKSQLEKATYIALKDAGFPVQYEPQKFVLWQGFKPTIPFYDKDKKTGVLKLTDKKMMDITYTPDFVFKYRSTLIVIESKGFENDAFPIKKKLFREWLENYCPNSIYFEVYSKKHILQAIDIIKKMK